VRQPSESTTHLDRLTKVEVIVSPARLRQIQGVLARVGVEGMTISEARGSGPSSVGRLVPRLKIEIVLENGRVPSLLDEILHLSRTPAGDGRIFLLRLDEAIRIRTKERGFEAV
jgi:nitrogen regulatory protein P-II 1